MPTIFDAVYGTALVCGSPYFLSKLIISERYRSGLAQRFGWLGTRKGKNPCVWIHGASVGEILTVKELVKSVEKEFNNLDIVISANTNTGLSVAERCFSGKKIFYFPLDLSWVVGRVLNAVDPAYVILIELEIWPNFLMAVTKKHIPLILVNARISEKSLKWYRVLCKISKGFFESLTNKENVFCARTETDTTRLMNLGIPEAQIFTTGNMKFDNLVTAVPEDTKERLLCLFEIGKDDKVVVCGSTHEGEEAILLRIFKQIRTKVDKLRLVLVPRHIERISEVMKEVESAGLRCVRKTALDKDCKIGGHKYETVILVDTVGELLNIYSIADCVFVGRSLVPQGGQNMMEPAGLAKPIIVGPHTFNFNEEVQLLKEANAIKIVHGEASLSNELVYLLEHPYDAQELGKRAQSVVMKQRGATERNLKVLRNILMKERAVSV
ncbi:MAG: 3-deoxy-D-manno-octulosonic acid transferase [Candidatus Brocadiales bacterium]|nr:3-deoxy-D-manno-octulosonic acid transferase [Candidatus Brocadiales bacterium]